MHDCKVLKERNLFLPFRDGNRLVLRFLVRDGETFGGWHAVVIGPDGSFIKEVDMDLVVACPPMFLDGTTREEREQGQDREAVHEQHLDAAVTLH